MKRTTRLGTSAAEHELAIKEQLLDEVLGTYLDQLHTTLGYTPDNWIATSERRTQKQRLEDIEYRIQCARTAVARGAAVMMGKVAHDLEVSDKSNDKTPEHTRRVNAVIESARAAGKRIMLTEALKQVEAEAKANKERGFSRKRYYNGKRKAPKSHPR